jgi:hypothetical protein
MTHRACARTCSDPLPRGAGNYIQQSALSAELKPLSGRNLMVVRSMQLHLPIQVSRGVYGSDSQPKGAEFHFATQGWPKVPPMGRLSPSSRCDSRRTKGRMIAAKRGLRRRGRMRGAWIRRAAALAVGIRSLACRHLRKKTLWRTPAEKDGTQADRL